MADRIGGDDIFQMREDAHQREAALEERIAYLERDLAAMTLGRQRDVDEMIELKAGTAQQRNAHSCAFCEQIIPRKPTPENLRLHVEKECQKHPMRELEKKLATALEWLGDYEFSAPHEGIGCPECGGENPESTFSDKHAGHKKKCTLGAFLAANPPSAFQPPAVPEGA